MPATSFIQPRVPSTDAQRRASQVYLAALAAMLRDPDAGTAATLAAIDCFYAIGRPASGPLTRSERDQARCLANAPVEARTPPPPRRKRRPDDDGDRHDPDRWDRPDDPYSL